MHRDRLPIVWEALGRVSSQLLSLSASSERVRPFATELDERQLAPHVPMSTRRGRDSPSFVPLLRRVRKLLELQKIAGVACREISGVHAMVSTTGRTFGAIREAIPGSLGAPERRPGRRHAGRDRKGLSYWLFRGWRHTVIKRITLAHECFSSFAAVTIGVPAHLASRSLASNSTVLTDPSGPSSQWATCIKPDASPPRPMDHWPAGGRRDFQTLSGAVPGIDIH